LTGYTSASGTVAATDNIVTAIGKLNGNDALKAPLASPTFTGVVTAPSFTSTAPTGTAPFVVTSTTAVANLSIGGNAATATTANNVSGTVAVANGGTGATTAAGALTNLGAQSAANLSTSMTTDAASTTKYPAVKTIKDYVDAAAAPDATTTATGKIQLAGDLAGTAASPTVTNAAVIGKVLTGYTSASGTVAATDNIVTAIGKLNGNDALKAPLASPTFTGDAKAETATAGDNDTSLATTAFVANAVSTGVTKIITKSTNYTATTNDYTILCDATTGFTLTLPAATTALGKMFIIRKIDETNNILTISPAISISSTKTISTLNFSKTLRVQSDGSSWFLID
jgi:hypothetical protein